MKSSGPYYKWDTLPRKARRILESYIKGEPTDLPVHYFCPPEEYDTENKPPHFLPCNKCKMALVTLTGREELDGVKFITARRFESAQKHKGLSRARICISKKRSPDFPVGKYEIQVFRLDSSPETLLYVAQGELPVQVFGSTNQCRCTSKESTAGSMGLDHSGNKSSGEISSPPRKDSGSASTLVCAAENLDERVTDPCKNEMDPAAKRCRYNEYYCSFGDDFDFEEGTCFLESICRLLENIDQPLEGTEGLSLFPHRAWSPWSME